MNIIKKIWHVNVAGLGLVNIKLKEGILMMMEYLIFSIITRTQTIIIVTDVEAPNK